MSIRYLISIMYLIGWLTGCQAYNGITEDMKVVTEQPSVHRIPAEKEVTIGSEDLQFVDQPEKIAETIKDPFKHPLLEIEKISIIPEHIQLTVGERAMEAIVITVLIKESINDLHLLLVDEDRRILRSIDATDMSQEDVLEEGIHSYVFHLQALEADQTYIYALNSGNRFSAIYSIRMPEMKNQCKIAIFGDLQGDKLSQYMRYREQFEDASKEQDIDIYWLMGDIVDRGDAYDQWDYYYQSMEGYDSQSIFATTIGNHDVKGSRDFYNSTFNYKKNGVGGIESNTGYFDLPSARVIIIDTEKPSTFKEQAQWLKEVVATSGKTFHIVMMHRSVYPVFYVEPHMNVWGEYFEEAGVDLVFSGHDHIYSRTKVDNVTYIITGSGSGSKFYDKSERRDWVSFIYDDNEPIYLIMDVSEDEIKIEAFVTNEGSSEMIDSHTVTDSQ